MAEHASKKPRVDGAGMEGRPQLSAGAAKLVEGLESALENYLCMARKLSQSDTSVGKLHVDRAFVGLRDAFGMFERFFPGFGVGWEFADAAKLADAAKIVLHTLETDPTGDTTRLVASNNLDVFTAYFKEHRWVFLADTLG